VSGLDQLQYLSWLLYLVVFVAVLVRTIRRPTPAHMDMTLFFGATAVVIVVNTLTLRLHVAEQTWFAADLVGATAMTLGYLLLRLVRDFSDVPTWLVRVVEVGLAAAVIAIVFAPKPLPPMVAMLLVTYLVLVIAYDTWSFMRQARRSRGVTRRRMQAAAAGSLFLTLTLVNAGIKVATPSVSDMLDQLGAALGLLSGVCYFIGFAPPTWLRRAWQEPELRNFLSLAATLPRLPDTRAIVCELERAAADALGAPSASIAVWDANARMLQIYVRPPETTMLAANADPGRAVQAVDLPIEDGLWRFDPSSRPVTGRAFLEQRANLVTDAARVDPGNAVAFDQYGARAVLSAPITAGDKRLGVLAIYAPRAPVFANSDLELVQLLADQAAVILESRALIDEASDVRAREEATRLKEDFLSSAAHDLKTPLTGLVTQAQVLQRRAKRNPEAPVDQAGVERLLQQSLRMRDLVLELLDVSRLEQGGLLGERRPVEVAQVARRTIKRNPTWQRVKVTADASQPAVAALDVVRFEQVLTNLIENALKYSPHDAPVHVRVWNEANEVLLSVEDRGIGIPFDDQPLVFDRFHRARNVDDRRFAGMGLGLYIARGIVEQHDGRMWVDSTPGQGSTFFVALPALEPDHTRPDEWSAADEGRLASA
jgi:signal transduction histidine kinase/FtsH-binding integral membrane protein